MTFLRTLMESSLRIAAVAGAVGLFLALAKVHSSELRHKAWAAVLAAMLLMPALPTLVPPMRVPVRMSAELPAITGFSQTAGVPGAVKAETAPMVVKSAPARNWNWIDFGLAVYAAVLLAMLGRLAAGWIAIRGLLRRATYVDRLNVFELDCISTPMTIGLARAAVLLPAHWKQWPEDKLNAVLAHEFAHVKRRDALTSFVAHVNRCVFWFHPLAWWLERHLASVAEQACDEAGIRALGESRKYAEVLLDIAETVSHAGRRIGWQGVGVDGTGMLGARIDRVLRGGAFFASPSRTQKWTVAAACLTAVLIAAACRQSIYSRPLKADPEETAREQKLAKLRAENNAARTMSPRQIADAEAAVAKNPEDLATRNLLVTAYHAKKETRELAAPHQIWLAEHHPEERNAWLWSKLLAPASFERMKAIWLAAADRPDAAVPLLSSAEAFFEYEAHDYREAEAILLRLQQRAPGEEWRRKLGRVYATVVTQGTVSPEFTAHSWKKLDESKDPVLLASAGLPIADNFGRIDEIKPELVAKGTAYLRRALEIDPGSRQAREGLEFVTRLEQGRHMRNALGSGSNIEEQFSRLSKLPESEQFTWLPDLAARAFMEGEGTEYYKHDAAGGRRYMELAQTYAQKLLSLCAGREKDPGYAVAWHRANMILGMAAMRLKGDRSAALKYLAAASTVRGNPHTDPLTLRLLGALLQYGGPEERKAVIEYCEREGQALGADDQFGLRKSAEQLRKGEMPHWYQYQIANK